MMGLRTSEVLERVVRDLDDGARYLWIDAGKTANARRRAAHCTPEPARAAGAALKSTLARLLELPDESKKGGAPVN